MPERSLSLEASGITVSPLRAQKRAFFPGERERERDAIQRQGRIHKPRKRVGQSLEVLDRGFDNLSDRVLTV
jgi:hypothetical protein